VFGGYDIDVKIMSENYTSQICTICGEIRKHP